MWLLDWIQLWKEIYFHPKATLEREMETPSFKLNDAYKQIAFAGFFFGLFIYIFDEGMIKSQDFISNLIPILIIAPICSIIVIYIYSIIIHEISRLRGGTGDFKTQTYLLALILAPYIILKYIPLVGFIIWFYFIYLFIITMKTIHRYSTISAIISMISPLVVLLLFITLLYLSL